MAFKSIRFYFTMVTVLLVGSAASSSAIALPVFQNSSVVDTVTNSATFDSIISNGINLSGYTEDGIIVDVPDISFIGFNAFNNGDLTAFHYGNGGNTSWVTISMVNGSLINALDFTLGNGNVGTHTDFIWETFVGATSTGFGALNLLKGSTVGWTDASGFDSIRVAAYGPGIDFFGQNQAIALDNLNIGTTSASVPEPSIIWLLGSGLALIGFARRKTHS